MFNIVQGSKKKIKNISRNLIEETAHSRVAGGRLFHSEPEAIS
jgi:hypothetical protein